MIKVYLAGIPSYHESESIEIRYRIFEDGNEIAHRFVKKDYQKPVMVSLFSLMFLLKELEKFDNQEITILMNDSAIQEQLKGTTTTKNKEVLKQAGLVREKIQKFDFPITVQDVSLDNKMIVEWNGMVEA